MIYFQRANVGDSINPGQGGMTISLPPRPSKEPELPVSSLGAFPIVRDHHLPIGDLEVTAHCPQIATASAGSLEAQGFFLMAGRDSCLSPQRGQLLRWPW